jgi:hypothetical protein
VLGQPFQHCLDLLTSTSVVQPEIENGWDNTNNLNGSEPKPRSKKRRRPISKSSSLFTLAPLVSKSTLQQCKVFIESLLTSLILPAVLFCQIQITGNRLRPLDTIHATVYKNSSTKDKKTGVDNIDIQLGYVTSGYFSVFHGYYTG